jgi:hypothetical protein
MRSALIVAASGIVVFALCLVAPLRQISGDTVPNRYGAALLACGGGYDLGGIAWLDRDRLPYWATRNGDTVVSVFGPAPPTVAAVAYLGIDSIDEAALRSRARIVAAFFVALATCLLVLAIAAQRSLRASIAFGITAAVSFAGAATLGQGLWQQTVSLPFLVGAVAMFAWREKKPRLALAVPGVLLAATLIRPTIAPLAIGIGIAWLLAHRNPRALAIAGGIALAAALPFVIWNVVYLARRRPGSSWRTPPSPATCSCCRARSSATGSAVCSSARGAASCSSPRSRSSPSRMPSARAPIVRSRARSSRSSS